MKACPIVVLLVVLSLCGPSSALGPEEVPSGLGPVSTALKARLEAPVSSEGASTKSEALAFGLSLLLPGAGQAYEGRWKSALVFLGVEVASWTGWYIWKEEGKDKEREYKNFADEHWSLDRFQVWMDNYRARYDTTWWTHVLPKEKGQEYYEMIGKYDQFAAGWEDYPKEWLDDPPEDNQEYEGTMRERYEDIRDESNRYLRRAGYMMGLVLVNRAISAILSLRGNGAQVGVVPGRDGPVLTASWRFR